MLLSGFGTAFLGPALPALAASAGALDSGSGLFSTGQFLGAFFGGVTTSRRLWRSLLRGSAAATAGFLLLALCAHRHATLPWTAASLVPLGFGVGQMLTSLNLLAAARFQADRGAALSRVNFTWSLGAVMSPFLLGNLLTRFPLPAILLCIAILFAVAFTAAARNARQPAKRAVNGDEPAHTGAQAPGISSGFNLGPFAYFAGLLLLYGGVETALSGWITTFGTRYGSGTLGISAMGATMLWIGITAGRALASSLLRSVKERTLLIASLLTATVLAACLSLAHGALSITVLAGCLGLALAPWFPLVLAGMLGEGASASQVGTIIAVSGLGAASLPLLVGEVSRAAGSLRVGLLVPLAGLVLLFALSFRRSATRAS